MRDSIEPEILSSSHRGLWRPTEPRLWTLHADYDGHDRGLSILRTILDQPRWLEAYHLYDEVGSQMFERICELPEYYLTRTENSILAEHASRIIAMAPVKCLVELGAGSSKKTLHLLKEQTRQRQGGIFAPIDVSGTSLALSRDIIRTQLPEITFHGLQSRYEEGISSIEKDIPTLFLFLGSTVGNFTHPDFARFFHHLSQSMGPQDYLLLGVDRVKQTQALESAYNDAQGVTAGFILNVFQNINRLTQSGFDLKRMCYHSWYNPYWRQVEMYAVSTSTQEIHFPAHDTSFVWQKDEKILVEISRKFEPERLQKQLQCFDLRPMAHFTDPQQWFSVLLFQKVRHDKGEEK